MPRHYSPKHTNKSSRVRAKKRFGQNFLVDTNVLDSIIEVAGVTKEDAVLEIGPGTGNLTKLLEKKAKKVIAIEIDRDLVELLSTEFAESDNVVLINQDILKVSLEELLQKEGITKVKIVANLPYYITTPIIMKILESHIDFSNMTVMVQKEVGLRMVASENTPDYGALSLAVSYYTFPRIAIEVPAGAFRPMPKVNSCVVTMEKRTSILEDEQRKLMFSIVKSAFSQRRKTLPNALSNQKDILSKEKCIDILKQMGKDENVRGEVLSLEDFIQFSLKVSEINKRED